MNKFTLHTLESAPEKSKPVLVTLNQKFGFIPNVAASMADNPVLLNGFFGSFGNFHAGGFDECEKQILLLTNAVTFKCPWTIAAHSTFAILDGVTESDVKAIRDGELPANPKYAALSSISKKLIASKGNLAGPDINSFVAAGYSQVQILEVVLAIGISTLTATAANLTGTPIEDRFIAVEEKL